MIKSVVTALTANETNTNVFAGTGIENIPNEGSLYEVTYLSTASTADVDEEVFVGQANPVELSDVSSQNRKPITPDDLVGSFYARPGEKIRVRVTEGGGAAANHFATLMVKRVR